MRKLLGLTVVFLLSLCQVWAQTKEVSGKVTDAKDGIALSGVTISAGGKSVGISGVDGSFRVNVPSSTRSIRLSFIGYTDVTATILSLIHI